MKAFRAVIRGDVQGVGFRASAAWEARRIGVTGWVRNTDDGSVEVWAEGNEPELEEFFHWLEHGPSTAWVREVQRVWEPPTGRYSSFGVFLGD